jgi:hypothetical protein
MILMLRVGRPLCVRKVVQARFELLKVGAQPKKQLLRLAGSWFWTQLPFFPPSQSRELLQFSNRVN